MDFQDFILEMFQDYGVIIVPIGVMGVIYFINKLTSKQSPDQYGLGQGIAAVIQDDKAQILKREAANSQMSATSGTSVDTADPQVSAAQMLHRDEYDDDESELDEVERGYGFEDDEQDKSASLDGNDDGFDEEEVYGDYIDDGISNKKQVDQTEPTKADAHQEEPTQQSDELTEDIASQQLKELGDLIIMYLVPNEKKKFLGYELLQSLANYHVHLSEKKHFQRFEHDNGDGELWYHVASMTHPGTFDMSEPGKLSCQGLVFILEVNRVEQLAQAYESMLDTCHYLADDLDARLLDDQQQPFQENIARRVKYFIAKQQIKEPV